MGQKIYIPGATGAVGPTGAALSDSLADKNLVPNATTGDGADSGLALSNTPAGNKFVYLVIGNVIYIPADGNGEKATAPCYFSGDGGTTARATAARVATDKMYWNGVQAGFDLDPATMTVNFMYEEEI